MPMTRTETNVITGETKVIEMSPQETAAFLPETSEHAQARLSFSVQQHLDVKAKERNYDNIHSAALRASYPGPFHDEGVAYATWMDDCWLKCYQILAGVKSGTRAIPTEAELLSELPTLMLP